MLQQTACGTRAAGPRTAEAPRDGCVYDSSTDAFKKVSDAADELTVTPPGV